MCGTECSIVVRTSTIRVGSQSQERVLLIVTVFVVRLHGQHQQKLESIKLCIYSDGRILVCVCEFHMCFNAEPKTLESMNFV